MNEKLLPCSFCGGEARIRTILRAVARCDKCGSYGQSFSMVDVGVEAASNQAIAAWNRRTPAPEGEVFCSGCEGRPVFPNIPCAVCGASTVVPKTADAILAALRPTDTGRE